MTRAPASHLLIAFAIAIAGPTSGGEDPRWYLVEFSSGEHLSARFIAEEKDFYIFNFQGAPLVVAKSGILKLIPLSDPGAAASTTSGFSSAPLDRAPAEGPAGVPAKEASGSAVPRKGPSEDALRDTLEMLGSVDDRAVAAAYRSLTKSFSAARPLLHEAVRHQNPRVRTRSLKLLGECGTPGQDLKVVADLLSDAKAQVRLAAGKALRALGPEGLPGLLSYLPGEREPSNRKMAIQTLKEWRDRRAVAPLVGLLEREPDRGVRSFIVVALEALTRQKLGADVKAWQDYISRDHAEGEVLHQMEMARPGEEPKLESGAESAGE